MSNEKRNKAEFVAWIADRLDRRQKLLDFRQKVFLPTLKKFDGKVYNVRFLNAIREQVTDKRICIREEVGRIDVQFRKELYSYCDYECISLRIELEGKRISYEKSLADHTGKRWIESFNEVSRQAEDAVENYDEYLAKAEEINKLINEYGKIPYEFRNNYLFRNLYYLNR